MFTVPLFWSVYWPIYDGLKAHIDESELISNPHVAHLVSAVTAGATGDIVTNPFWVTRTRIQALILHKQAHISEHIGMIAMMRRIFAEEGFRAFYKGLAASFLGLSHVAIQFPLCKPPLSLLPLQLRSDPSTRAPQTSISRKRRAGGADTRRT